MAASSSSSSSSSMATPSVPPVTAVTSPSPSFSFMDMAKACWRSKSSSLCSSSTAPPAEASTSMASPLLASSAKLALASLLAAAAAAALSCRARSSSIDTRNAMANSGSILGSTPPNSANPPTSATLAPPPTSPAPMCMPPPPSPPCTIGLETRTSLGSTPGGMVTKWQLSCVPLAALTSSFIFSSLPSFSPMRITSIATLFFFSCRPALVRAFASHVTGLPMKMITRCPPFLLRRCFNAKWATCTAAGISFPTAPLLRTGTPWSADKILPMSSVGLTNSSASFVVSTPTVFSGLL
mmetsp:Transcript_19035/g.29417  ORF Transcript_19035/g.29417 Transcript_19035/m.29417 type:complete len:296 (-) Transcript_19035:167-1054(-)